MSMYSIAKTIGLPATFVELRHQATHEQLPSLSKLRSAANNALAWIWDFYWKDLGPVNKRGPKEDACSDPQRDMLLLYLREQDEALKLGLQKQLETWNQESLLRALAGITESSEDPQIILRGLQLSRKILSGGIDLPATAPALEASKKTKDLEAIRVELQNLNEELEDAKMQCIVQPTQLSSETNTKSIGWSRYQGAWTPKPIGMV